MLKPALIALFLTVGFASAEPYNGSGSEVMLQGFHWQSYLPARVGNKPWYRIVRENAGRIQQAGFDCIWLPPPSSSSASDNPYLPNRWYIMNNGYGDQDQLRMAVSALKPKTFAICDIVVNHRCGTATGGADFTEPPFGTPSQNAAAITRDDDSRVGTGRNEENHDNGSQCEKEDGAGRDLDHTNPRVQSRIQEFQDRLLELGFRGWRYDMVKGYHGIHVGDYNDASRPRISVGEYWSDNAQEVVDWIDETRGRSMAFDFPTRAALVRAVGSQNYSALKTEAGKAPGVIGMWPEMAVTFLENHDTEPVRDNGVKRFPDNKAMQGYCYILTHPGIPCIFWTHFFDQGDAQAKQITRLIQLRKQSGINSRSSVFIEPDTSGKYAAVIDDKVAVKIGPASWSPGPNWDVVVDGPEYAVWKRK